MQATTFQQNPAYNFASGNATKILSTPLILYPAGYLPVGFCLQVNFTGLTGPSAATVYLMLGNDSVNFQRITGKEFAIAAPPEATGSFLILGEQYLCSAKFLQLGITVAGGTGILKSVILGI
jgi:hypothetical protein